MTAASGLRCRVWEGRSMDWWFVFGLLFVLAVASEPPSPQDTVVPGDSQLGSDARLDDCLANYEKRRQEIKDFRIIFTQTRDDQVFRTMTRQQGEALGAGTDLLRVTTEEEASRQRTIL